MSVVEKVADNAATRAAEKVSGDLRLDMANMEARIKQDFDRKVQEVLGMTAHEHAIQHNQLKTYIENDNLLSQVFRKKGMVVLFLILAGLTGYGGSREDVGKAVITALVGDRREQAAMPVPVGGP